MTDVDVRSKQAKIDRLVRRINELGHHEPASRPVLDILKGVLDLLKDEL